MKLNAVSGIMLTLLLFILLILVSNVGAVENLELEMTVSNTTITIGEWIDITLTLRNIGTSNVTIWYTGALFDVYYCTPYGCFYYTDGMCFPAVVFPLTLEPSQNYTETFGWNLYQYINGAYYPPESGTYYLWGKCYWENITTSSPTAVTLVETAPEYNLTIHSSPYGITFTVDGVSRTTPWSGTYSKGASVSLVMPETHEEYVWTLWLEDGDTNRTKTVTMDTNITLTGVFTPLAVLADLNKDGKVDIDDVVLVALSFGSYPTHPRWNPIADLTKDDKLDIDDVVLVAVHFGEFI